MNDSSGVTGAVVAMLSAIQTRKRMKSIQEGNYERQGITYYQPSYIESFFDEGLPFGNMAFSGGLNIIRARAIGRVVDIAIKQGYYPVILHCANQELEQLLFSNFGNKVSLINRSNPIYDPFWGSTDYEISSLVLSSSSKGYEIGSAGKYYLDGVTEFIRSKGITPYSRMYIRCPHLTLLDKINDAETSGKISSTTARRITSQLMQGEKERSNIENFFNTMLLQADGILSKKRDLSASTNVALAAAHHEIISFDVLSTTNYLLLNMITKEIERQIASGKKYVVIIDSLSFVSNDVLKGFVSRISSNSSIVFSSDDVYSLFSGNDNMFYSFLGQCSTVMLSKHISSFSCQKWSDYIGSYDKQEVNSTFSTNIGIVQNWSYGTGSAASVTTKRENIVKPEEIMRLAVNEFYVIDKATGELAHAQIV